MQKEYKAHERDDNAFFDQGRNKRADRPLNELGTVIDLLDLDAFGQTGFESTHALFHR